MTTAIQPTGAPKPYESILDRPLVEFGREICGDLDLALRREWLVTNGIGGYASATVPGTLTRSYHGLLVAALDPPVERTVLLAGLDEWITYADERYPLATHEFAPDTVGPQGFRHLESFRLDGSLPIWHFAVADALIEKRVWMVRGQNTTVVQYRLLRGSAPVVLDLIPLLSYRSFHALQFGRDQAVQLSQDDGSVEIRFGESARPFWLSVKGTHFEPHGEWWWNFRFREETRRGLQDVGDLDAAGLYRCELRLDEPVRLLATTDLLTSPLEPSLFPVTSRQQELLASAGAVAASPLTQQLVLAADQFIVSRPLPDDPHGESIIAGYHWFNDWGRDTMIALPGLCLTTGRWREAKWILQTFANYIDQGVLPNNFPDRTGALPGYNTADATLWYGIAIYRYLEATGDASLISGLLPVLEEIVHHHRAGTHFHIGVDPADGLLAAGEPGVQLTWMDAKVGDWVVTPRIGKPVEINALWYNFLKIMTCFESQFGSPSRADDFDASAQQVRTSFQRRFSSPDRDHLADVVDGPGGDDWSIRPNQIFALSLPFPMVDGDGARRILDVVGRSLLTSYGLRSLAPDDPAFIGTYGGDQLHRDGAYHQGTVWSWLLGPFAEAHYRLNGNPEAAMQFLAPLHDHLRDAGLGSISEIFEAEAPFAPRGCIAQAWSVGECLRVLRLLEGSAPSPSPAGPATSDARTAESQGRQ